MIVLLEPVCPGWMHEEVNAGLLKLISEEAKEQVMYVAEKEHLKCVSKLYSGKNVEYEQLGVAKPLEEADQYRLVGYYYYMLNAIWKRYQPSHVFITCAYRPCILAAELFSLLKKPRIHIVLHGMIENGKKNAESYSHLIKASEYCSNLDFITYSPYCTAEYWGIKEEKMKFLHHPYIKASKYDVKKKSDKLVVGIIGACANQKALNLIKLLNGCERAGDFEFWVASRFGKKFKGISNVKLIDLSFERKVMEKQIQQMDYLLLLYGRDEYKISASGVLWDAVSNEIPCLFLDCKYFDYYEPYKIGYQTQSIKGLFNVMLDNCVAKRTNEKKYYMGIEQLEMYNKVKIREMLML